MNLRIASVDEFEKIRVFYHYITDWLDTVPYGPGWKKDIYPSPEELTDALNKQQLWVYETNCEYAGAMIINSDSNDGYSQVNWNVDAHDNEITLIHALGVKPEYQGRGIASEMVQHAINLAKSQRHKALRLDVLEGNLPAEKLYPKHGFVYVETVEMFYEDTGLANYELFELPL